MAWKKKYNIKIQKTIKDRIEGVNEIENDQENRKKTHKRKLCRKRHHKLKKVDKCYCTLIQCPKWAFKTLSFPCLVNYFWLFQSKNQNEKFQINENEKKTEKNQE